MVEMTDDFLLDLRNIAKAQKILFPPHITKHDPKGTTIESLYPGLNCTTIRFWPRREEVGLVTLTDNTSR